MQANRRDFVKASSQSCLLAAFAQTVVTRNLLAQQLPAELDDWIDDLYRTGEQLNRGEITGGAWQNEIDRIYRSANIDALMKHVDFDKVAASMDLEKHGEVFITTPLRVDPSNPPRLTGPEGRGVITKIAGTRKGSAVPPHGHLNMVSAFLIISGEYRVVQYDKLGSEGKIEPGEGHLYVRKFSDDIQKRGQWSSISDDRSNLHWLRGISDDCYFFSCKLIRLQEDQPFHGRINIDVNHSRNLGGGKLKSPIIDGRRAAELYG